MRFDFEPCGGAPYSPIYRAQIAGDPRLAPLIGRLSGLSDLRSRAEAIDARWRGDRGMLAAALAAYQTEIGGNVAAARRLGESGAVAVVAGQQAGLFTGPLFAIYKALTLLDLARRCEAALDRPVVPVYWVASEDHDFDEVASTWGDDAAGEIVRLTLPRPAGAGRRSVGDLELRAEDAVRLQQRLVGLVPQPDPRARARLEGCWCPGQGLAGWFARQLAALFAERGLVILDPMLAPLRRAALPLASLAWERAPDVEAELAAGAERLQRVGFGAALEPEPGHTHLFARLDGERQLLLHRQGVAVTRQGERVDVAALAPDELSYGVALRPVVEAVLLPVLAHVSGPGEVAYQAQIGGVFATLGVDAPPVVPRLGLTLVPPDAAPFAAAGAGLRRLRGEPLVLVDQVLARESGLDVAARFAAEQADMRARYAALERDLTEVSPSLAGIVRANLERVLAQLDYLERKARQHRRRGHREFVRAAAAARNRLFPRGRLQEQALNVWPFLLRFGVVWLDSLCDALPSAPGHHVARWTAD